MADKPKLKTLPKIVPKGKPAPFDPKRTNPYSTDKEFIMNDDLIDLESGPTPRRAEYEEKQLYMAPSKRDNPPLTYSSGGMVKHGSSTKVGCGSK